LNISIELSRKCAMNYIHNAR